MLNSILLVIINKTLGITIGYIFFKTKKEILNKTILLVVLKTSSSQK